MNNMSVHDFIVPTNPIAALLFGILFTFIVVIIVYVETKELKVSLYTLLIAVTFVSLAVFLLYQIGYYK